MKDQPEMSSELSETDLSPQAETERLRQRLEDHAALAKELVLAHDRELEEVRKVETITAANLARQLNRNHQLDTRVKQLEKEIRQAKAIVSGEALGDGPVSGIEGHPELTALRADNKKKALKIHAMGTSRRWQFAELFANARRNPRKMLSLPFDLIAFVFRR